MLNIPAPLLGKGRQMDWSEYSKSLFEKQKKAEMPFHACFELTPLCNFKCNMCYVRLSPEQAKAQGRLLDTQQWIDIAKQAKKMGTITLEVTGGEAITRRDFPVLYEAFAKMGFLVHLRTNGYLINDGILELLQRYKPKKISVTMYGASDETYQKICGISDGFSVVTRNIRKMKEAGLNVRLTMTVTKDNVEDVEKLDEWAKKQDYSITPYGALFTPIRGAKRSIDHLKIDLEGDSDISGAAEAEQHQVSDRELLMNPFWLCRGFGAVFCISWDGRITLCNTLTQVWKEPLLNGLENAYHDLYDELKKLKRPKECASCNYIEYCAACPSFLQSATGSAEHTCDDVCRLARRKYRYFELKNKKDQEIKKEVADIYCDDGGLYKED